MAQQTAVDWLANELKSKGHALITSEGVFINVPNELLDKAKAMEKEQMIHFAETMPKKKGITQEREPYVQYDAEQYYNETYNK
jgi:predicted nucleic-acid-binding protein